MTDVIQNLDGALLLGVQNLRVAVLDPLVIAYTHLGDVGMIWILLSAAMLLYKPTRKAGFAGLLALVFGFLCTNVTLKHLVGRERPWLNVAGLIPLIEEHDPNSFPSGHTCAAFAAAVAWVIGTEKTWLRVLCVGAAACMGFSRLYVGVHYPLDVLVGAVVGTLCAVLARKMLDRKKSL